VHTLPRSGRPRRLGIDEPIKDHYSGISPAQDENVRPSSLSLKHPTESLSLKLCPKCEDRFTCSGSTEAKTRKRFRRRAGKMYDFYRTITSESFISTEEIEDKEDRSDCSQSCSENSDSDQESTRGSKLAKQSNGFKAKGSISKLKTSVRTRSNSV
jgi:hypothetical protein